MDKSTASGHSGAPNRRGSFMRLPLELIIMVLEALAASSEQSELIYMRTVSRVFDELIVKTVFQSQAFASPRRIINGTTWRSAPESLRERYLFHLLQSRHAKPTAFSFLAAPVFKRELQRLNVTNISEADALVRKWCTLSMHEVWNLSWVVAHNRSTYNENKARVKRYCQFFSGRWASLSDTDTAAERRRVITDSSFLRIALHIVNDEQDAALQLLFPKSFVCTDDLNYCFGSTVLGVAVRWGTESMVKRILDEVSTTSEQHLHVYLKLAGRRQKQDSYVVTALILDRFQGIANSRVVLLQRIFLKAIRIAQTKSFHGGAHDKDYITRDNKAILDNVMRWTASRPAAHGMLDVLQECYRRLSDRWGMPGIEDERQRIFDRGPSSDNTGSASPRNPIPAFVFGSYYKHAIVREVVRACCRWEKYQFNRLCQSPDFDGRCGCRGYTSERCTCYMRLRGYYKPDYIYVNPGKLVFDAASRGLLHWVDWLLWGGADPRNKTIEESLLFWARYGGIQNEVAGLLVRYGWDVGTLTTFPRASTMPKSQASAVSVPMEQEYIGAEVEPEVWAAGSESEDSPWNVISNAYQTKFWAAW